MTVVPHAPPFASVADMTIAELAVLIAAVRRPGVTPRAIAGETGRWFGYAMKPDDFGPALARLTQLGRINDQDGHFSTSEAAWLETERTARGLVRLFFRDRFFFDVGKLLEVTLVREDHNAR